MGWKATTHCSYSFAYHSRQHGYSQYQGALGAYFGIRFRSEPNVLRILPSIPTVP